MSDQISDLATVRLPASLDAEWFSESFPDAHSQVNRLARQVDARRLQDAGAQLLAGQSKIHQPPDQPSPPSAPMDALTALRGWAKGSGPVPDWARASTSGTRSDRRKAAQLGDAARREYLATARPLNQWLQETAGWAERIGTGIGNPSVTSDPIRVGKW